MKTVLIAVGGNALFDAEGGNNIDPLKLSTVCNEIANVVRLGYQPIITFGNGPQVGNLLEMSERFTVPPKWPIPLDVCVAWTQAEIGYFLGKEIHNHLLTSGTPPCIASVNTTVVVDTNDPAFLNPTKFIGNFYDKADAEALCDERGWQMTVDSNRGYRRVVPSPVPIRIVEEDSIRLLVEGGCVVLCGGGGGIPVIEEAEALRGTEAVIDKDHTACLLAERLQIQEIVICTGVSQVCLNYGTPEEKPLDTVSVAEAKAYLAQGHFPPGSMGPKVEALVHFVEQGGERAIITRLQDVTLALNGKAGTRFTA